jgi:hypothetical protein
LNKLERYEAALNDIRKECVHPILPSEHFVSVRVFVRATVTRLAQTGITTVSDNALVVAQQLTHIELERLAMIGPEEFVYSLIEQEQQILTDDDVYNDNAALRRPKTHNIQHYVDWFNRLASLVATDITKVRTLMYTRNTLTCSI